MRESFPKLAKFPQIGKQRSELAPLLRSFPVKNYLIFYRPIDEGIEIVRILYRFFVKLHIFTPRLRRPPLARGDYRGVLIMYIFIQNWYYMVYKI
ncbi:MAG: type II toxin-antitoxin system RelE/ParE family toxin [Nostoc sp. ChiSLP01]|nr:type II toxin-antitoxin system RelE/ParE family toxin [Nostoc sp. CmiSLP01]MDZ8282284.1 type II toxin-antitoxin system RelE/ParE family toxin [Nostoc sp. ChiSLP01]